MTQPVTIALIGDYKADVVAHQAIPPALALAGAAVGSDVSALWVPTAKLSRALAPELTHCNGIWCVPASPYQSMDGALRAIRFARESGRPFLGTCGGFQHAVLEYFRHVLGMTEAEHLESSPHARLPVIAPLPCALLERADVIHFAAGSRIRNAYGRAQAEEEYRCSYGLNARFEHHLAGTDLRIVGRDAAGEIRAVELAGHPFYVATLFQPERSALHGQTHPLIRAFVQAAATARADSSAVLSQALD